MKKKFNQLAGVLICIAFGVFLLFIMDRALVIWDVICKIASILTPFLYAFALAYILNFPYSFFRNKVFGKFKGKFWKKASKPLSLIITYVLFIGFLSFLISILIPQLTENINNLITNLPEYFDEFILNVQNAIVWINNTFGINLNDLFENLILNLENINDIVLEQISTLFAPEKLEAITSAVYDTAMFFYNWIMGFIISIYLLSSKELLARQLKRFCTAFLPTMWMPKLYRIADVTDNKCGKFLVGEVLDATIVSCMCFISMMLLNIPYAPLISVIVGVSNVIPFFGPFIGGIPSAIILLLVSPIESIKFIILIFVIQQIDGNIIKPKVIGSQVGLVGFWSFFSVLLAGGLFGVPGMILGTPIFAAIYTLVGDRVSKRIKNKGEAATRVLEMPVINSSNLTNIKAEDVKIKKIKFKKSQDKQENQEKDEES